MTVNTSPEPWRSFENWLFAQNLLDYFLSDDCPTEEMSEITARYASEGDGARATGSLAL